MTAAEFKEWALSGAEIADAWRVLPRIFMGIFLWLLVDAHFWYKSVDVPTETQQWYLNVLWVAVAGVTKFYLDSGRKWTP